MKNKEIEYLLNEMKDTTQDYIGTNGCKYQDLLREEIDLLLSYIEQLENNRDKAIEFLKTEHMTYDSAWEWRQALIKTLRGGSND